MGLVSMTRPDQTGPEAQAESPLEVQSPTGRGLGAPTSGGRALRTFKPFCEGAGAEGQKRRGKRSRGVGPDGRTEFSVRFAPA